jgi:hypothetical protein
MYARGLWRGNEKGENARRWICEECGKCEEVANARMCWLHWGCRASFSSHCLHVRIVERNAVGRQEVNDAAGRQASNRLMMLKSRTVYEQTEELSRAHLHSPTIAQAQALPRCASPIIIIPKWSPFFGGSRTTWSSTNDIFVICLMMENEGARIVREGAQVDKVSPRILPKPWHA